MITVRLTNSEVSLLICYLQEKSDQLTTTRPKVVPAINTIKEKLIAA